ncbi:hypothetical protein [Hymenobacter negativus]|uniref:SPOR domain-containing protein n=1 Tax=Hymenobacter negativus TaxID=2795026 RepID=A0ABS3QJA5_9BACT|nr:hypothetical protein [Hymenobacter negativus]MBO2011103.1 hypothetical protein [Hymenobacter negativus]
MKLHFLVYLSLLLAGFGAAAQAPDSLVPLPMPTGAAVVLAPADTLFRVYGRVGAFGPKERAEAIARRLDALPAPGGGGPAIPHGSAHAPAGSPANQ